MKKILLIEDDVLMNKLYVDVLKGDDSIMVTTTFDGEAGYEQIMIGGWDLILLDGLLPKLNAVQILDKVKANDPEKLKQPIIILTNLEGSTIMDDLKSYKYELLYKSQLNPQELLDKVKNSLK
jgi:DNA-binding response OmpR family regulator